MQYAIVFAAVAAVAFAGEAPKPTPAAEWAPAPVEHKCTSYTTYTTTDCGNKKNDWETCDVYTKTSEVYPEDCGWTTYKTPEPKPTTWAPAPVEEKKKCTSYSTYTTTDCGHKKNDWETCDVYTKTSTYYPDTCTWAEYTYKTPDAATTWSTYKTPEAATTWSTYKTPEAATTWAPAPVKPSSSVSAPVAKWTGAADKQTFGMGAIAIAAVAAML